MLIMHFFKFIVQGFHRAMKCLETKLVQGYNISTLSASEIQAMN